MKTNSTGNKKLTLSRRSIRLNGYDYSQAGAYFVTICTQNRLHLFGEITNDEMVLNEAGMMVEKWWNELNHIREYLIINPMQWQCDRENPNHIHGDDNNTKWNQIEEIIYGK